ACVLLCSSLLLFSCSKDDGPGNQPPKSFKLIEVADGATNVELQPQLKWEAATDPDGDQVTYQVYLGTQNSPQTSIANNLDLNTFTIEDALQSETTYYWMVVAKDNHGNTTESNVISFTTRKKTMAEAIVGKWFLENISTRPLLSDCEKQHSTSFAEDLTYISEYYNEDSNGSCTRSAVSGGEYEVEGDQLDFVTQDGLQHSYVIQSLTETELVLDLNGEIYTYIKE